MKERSVPVVLIVEKGMTAERRALAEWLRTSQLMSCDAFNVFDAIEEMADFTVRDRPDVIVLDVDRCSESVDLIRAMLRSDKAQPSIMAIAPRSKGLEDCFHGDLSAVTARLGSMISGRAIQ